MESDLAAVSGRDHTSGRGRRLSLTRVIDSVIATVLLVTLAGYMLLGIFNRYVADDYGGVLAVRLRGFWGEQVAAYQLWTGRFTSSALTSAAAMLPEGSVRVLPALLIASWVLLVALALRHVLPSVARAGRLLIAAGVVYATLQVTPSPFLSIYWRTGSLTYVPSLLLATLLLTVICRPDGSGRQRIATLAAAGVIAFLAGGSNETYVVAQTVALTLAVVLAISPLTSVRRSNLRVLGAALLGSLIAVGVLVGAPGNAIRDAAILRIVGQHPSLLQVPRLTAQFTWQFFDSLLSAHWVSLLAVAVLAALLAARSAATPATPLGSLWVAGGATTIGAIIVVTSAIVPSAFEEGRLTNGYGQIVLVYVCVCAVAALGWFAGRGWRILAGRPATVGPTSRIRRTAPGLMVLVASAFVAAGPIVTVAGMVGDLPAVQAWAATKDAEAAAATSAHAAGQVAVTVQPLRGVNDIGVFSHPAYEDLMSDPHFWINRDEAAYYGVVSMATSPAP